MSDDEEDSRAATSRFFYWGLFASVVVGLLHEFSIGSAGQYTDWQMTQQLIGTLIMFLLMGIGMELHKIRQEVAQ